MDSPIKNIYNDSEIMAIIEAAAALGAKKALADIGLHDENAGKDVEEIRGLLDAWRSAKKAAWDTIVRFFTGALLMVLAIGVYFKTKN